MGLPAAKARKSQEWFDLNNFVLQVGPDLASMGSGELTSSPAKCLLLKAFDVCWPMTLAQSSVVSADRRGRVRERDANFEE